MRHIQCTAVPIKRMLPWLAAWLVMLGCALAIDQPISQWLYDHGFHNPKSGVFKATPWANTIRFFGTYYAVMILSAILLLARKLTWRKAAALLICSATAAAGDVLKWIVGRSRPVTAAGLLSSAMDFVPFSKREPGNAMPSGHAMLAFATAACLARYYPRWSPLFYILASLVALERVLEVAHYPSDVVAAAGIGIMLSQACMWALLRLFPDQQPRLPNALEDVKQ
jgi:membrane-associated phospholipid phosphatase